MLNLLNRKFSKLSSAAENDVINSFDYLDDKKTLYTVPMIKS